MAIGQGTTALLGAGVSVGAGLPTAFALIDELLAALVHRDWARDELMRLARPGRPDMLDVHDVLRFETLLLWVGDVYEEELGLFRFLDEYRDPGELHLRFAGAALAGTRLVTTNFDDLLERAILALGGVARTVDAHGRRAKLADVPVLKLHGTRVMHRAGRIERAANPLHATTEVIAAANPGDLLNGAAERALRDAVDGRHLIVAGYSASDDLDIVPQLEEAAPLSVTWVDHGPGPSRSWRLDELAGEESSWLTLCRQWAGRGIPVSVQRGPATESCEAVGLPLPRSPLAPPRGEPWRKTIRAWAREVRRQDPTGLGLAGLLFGEMQRHDLAERAIRESRGSRRDPDAGWTAARRRYELAQTALLRDGADPDEVARLALRARREAVTSGDRTTALFSLLLLGRAQFLQQLWPEAAATFGSAAAEAASPRHRAYADSWLGRTLAWSGHPIAAIAPLRAGIPVMRRDGNLEGLLDALDGLALAEHQRGRLDAAERGYAEAESIAEDLGFADRRFTVRLSRASVAWTAGDIDVAERFVSSAFALDQATHDEIAVAWALSADIHFERGRIAEAREDAGRAIAATTVITRGELAGLRALEAELLLRQGDIAGARASARAVRDLPAENSSWTARLHALVVLVAVGDEHAGAVSALLRARPALLPPMLVRVADLLLRNGFERGAARVVIARAQRTAARMGATRWATRFDLPSS